MRHYTAVRGDWEDGDVEGTLEALAGAMRATGVDIDAPDSQGCSALHCGLDPSVRALITQTTQEEERRPKKTLDAAARALLRLGASANKTGPGLLQALATVGDTVRRCRLTSA